MYLYGMLKGLRDIIGVWVGGCSSRIRVRTFYERDNKFPKTLDLFQLIYFTEGGATFRFSDHTIAVQAGDAFVFEPFLVLERTPVKGNPLSYWVLSFYCVNSTGRVNFRETGLPEVCSPEDRNVFSKQMETLFRCFSAKAPGWRQTCSIQMLNILGQLAPQFETEGAEPAGPDDRLTEKRIGDVLKYVNEHYKKRLGVNELARMVKMHPVHFSRLFKKETGLAPHRYILEKKIAKAKDFLLHYNESLTTTAAELGFHDYAHFYRVFSQLTGESPRQFLKRSQGK